MPDRPLLTVDELLAVVPVSERSLRRALEPGGDLAFLAVRVGRRVFARRNAFEAWLAGDNTAQVTS